MHRWTYDNRHTKEFHSRKSHHSNRVNLKLKLEGMLEVIHSMIISGTNVHEQFIEDKRMEYQNNYKKLTGHYYYPRGK